MSMAWLATRPSRLVMAQAFCEDEAMFVTNHVLSGVLVGRALKRKPATAFVVGVGSHLLLDAIPHWGCDREAPGGEDRFLRAAKRDGLLGLAVLAIGVAAADRSARWATALAIAGAVLLDLDKPIEYFFGVYPFPEVVALIHGGVQNESYDGMKKEFVYGAALASAATASTLRGRRSSGSEPGGAPAITR
jgi:hypothetical protein